MTVPFTLHSFSRGLKLSRSPHTDWCHNRDSNPDAIWQQILNLPCLPVSTLWHRKSPAKTGLKLDFHFTTKLGSLTASMAAISA